MKHSEQHAYDLKPFRLCYCPSVIWSSKKVRILEYKEGGQWDVST